MRKGPLILFLLVSLLLPTMTLSTASAGKVEPALLERLAAEGRADFVVHFAERADLSPAFHMDWRERGRFVYQTLRATARRAQARAIAYLEGRGLIYESFFAGNVLYVRQGDLAAAEFLAALPEVASLVSPRISSIEPLIPAEPTAPQGLTWGIVDTKADQFWSTFGLQGEGIVVANIDTGVAYLHPALDQAYKCRDDPGNPACWYDPGNVCGGIPCDNVGHGTATMGVMVSDDDPSLPYQAGMAPGAQWIACKGCQSTSCYEVDLNACADWILAPAGNPDNRPHVVGNAWGGAGCNTWFQDEVQAWVAAGIFPAFSPGGSGPSCGTISSPADYQEAFAAGAYDSLRNIAPFSSRGPSCFGHDPYTKPNLSAPGVNICVPIPPSDWYCYSGTSFSGSFPPGAVALLWSCAPGLVGAVYPTFEALQNTADPPPPGNCGAPPDGEGNYTYGYGYLNVLAAGQAYCTAAAPPEASFTSSSPVCLGETMRFTDTSQAAPPVTEWFWAFGDGGTSNLQNPTHLYASTGDFVVTLVVTNSEGSDSVTDTVVVHPLPEVSFVHSPPSGMAPLTVHFTATLQEAISPTWSFGDGDYGAGEVVSHTYALAGLYTATLTATSPYGCGVDTATARVEVRPTPYLTATFRAEPAGGCAPLEVAFTDESTGDPPIVSWWWDFGDGVTSTVQHPTHTYGAAGTYEVMLTVSNISFTASATGTVVVHPLPEVSFVHSPPSGMAPLTVHFTATLQEAISPTWSFGDGDYGAGEVVSHTYALVGLYTATLTATSPYGCGVDTAAARVEVYPPVRTYTVYLPLVLRGH